MSETGPSGVEDPRPYERYFAAMRRHYTPEEFEGYLKELSRYFDSPEQFGRILRKAGTPQELEELIMAVKERSEDWEWARTARQKISLGAKIMIATGAAFMAASAIWSRLVEWIAK